MTESAQREEEALRDGPPPRAAGPAYQPVDWIAWISVAAMLLAAAAFALR
ncbi:MAG: hypothetical protein R3316_04695 [Rhodovibrionaceae bacterium]|nr:hypothetical protein [Rhodovibrionaceae bacterium]